MVRVLPNLFFVITKNSTEISRYFILVFYTESVENTVWSEKVFKYNFA